MSEVTRRSFINNQGTTLAEVVVGIGIVGVLALIIVGGSNFISRHTKTAEEAVEMNKMVSEFVDEIRSNIKLYQIDFNPEEFLQAVAVGDLERVLPLAWDEKGITSKEACPNCPGRAGFVITPLDNYRGLYKLQIRVTHKTLIKDQNFVDYSFLIKGQ